MVIVRVAVTRFALGITELGWNVQPACAGNPLMQEKLIAVAKEPWGDTVNVNFPGDPALTVALVGLAASAKVAELTVRFSTREVLPLLLVSPPYTAVIECCPAVRLDIV